MFYFSLSATAIRGAADKLFGWGKNALSNNGSLLRHMGLSRKKDVCSRDRCGGKAFFICISWRFDFCLKSRHFWSPSTSRIDKEGMFQIFMWGPQKTGPACFNKFLLRRENA
jgi:hypothetical protein